MTEPSVVQAIDDHIERLVAASRRSRGAATILRKPTGKQPFDVGQVRCHPVPYNGAERWDLTFNVDGARRHKRTNNPKQARSLAQKINAILPKDFWPADPAPEPPVPAHDLNTELALMRMDLRQLACSNDRLALAIEALANRLEQSER